MSTKLIGSPSASYGYVFATGENGALYWKTQDNADQF